MLPLAAQAMFLYFHFCCRLCFWCVFVSITSLSRWRR